MGGDVWDDVSPEVGGGWVAVEEEDGLAGGGGGRRRGAGVDVGHAGAEDGDVEFGERSSRGDCSVLMGQLMGCVIRGLWLAVIFTLTNTLEAMGE